jgi:hypothetical protein
MTKRQLGKHMKHGICRNLADPPMGKDDAEEILVASCMTATKLDC